MTAVSAGGTSSATAVSAGASTVSAGTSAACSAAGAGASPSAEGAVGTRRGSGLSGTGTPNIAGAIGLGAALDYLSSIGLSDVAAHEQDLLHYATSRLSEIDGLRIIGTASEKASVISFTLEGVHPHDIGTILDQEGIAVRTGHHCAQPLMMRFNVPATGRASFGLYNTREEADALVAGLHQVVEVFRG